MTIQWGASRGTSTVQARRTDVASAWQQLQLRGATERVAWTHRYRLEQRWIGAAMADGDLADWRNAKRVRYMVRATAPFAGRTIDPGERFVAASLAAAGHRRPPPAVAPYASRHTRRRRNRCSSPGIVTDAFHFSPRRADTVRKGHAACRESRHLYALSG